MFRATAEHAGLNFTVEIPDTPVTVEVDRAMWSTIVTNLVSNALKYTARGDIRIRLTATETDAVLTVADTGAGIDADQQKLVFDRFYRATDGQERGAGIGLAVVADLVDVHHGHLDLDSEPGRGSTFTVTVPLLITPAAPNRPATPPRIPRSRPPGTHWLLLVEDDTDLREFLTRLLTADGWAVRAVADAETALRVGRRITRCPGLGDHRRDAARAGRTLVGRPAPGATGDPTDPDDRIDRPARRGRHRRRPGRRRRRLHHQTILVRRVAGSGARQLRTLPAPRDSAVTPGRGPR